MSQTFKVGDRVICNYYGYSTQGKSGVVVSFDGHTYMVECMDKTLAYYPYELLPVEKEPTMKIGEHEVKVVSNNEVKVGCQSVTREQVKEVLRVMDERKAKFKKGDFVRVRSEARESVEHGLVPELRGKCGKVLSNEQRLHYGYPVEFAEKVTAYNDAFGLTAMGHGYNLLPEMLEKVD